eukprot:CAMPEP_0185847334 /NCGR_PEP_ID=MMETSP1354-20130828/2643_1 /TAXON_ID=708628 /ORGANISM="Erythrolobus madagascarensis, Strain CCMP3276" /LENGTH=615 /DNA_ID=CAMNT_0028547613 /DNA_START=1 /DNA_END=1845 /DNA_ORIENTATION=-
MRKDLVRQKELSALVRREIRVMRQLNHRNIVKLHQVMATSKKIFIVMELVTGGELFDEILSKKRLPENEARVYFRQLIDGVEHCHVRGVFHRDLKPENLLLDGSGVLKITDFGLSALKAVDTSAELLYTQCGTPHYVAPEIISRASEGYSGAKIDVWSCGIILFVLLSGYLPFDDDKPELLFKQILSADVKYPSWFSEGVQDLLGGLLCVSPEQRASIKQIRKHAWFRGFDMRISRTPSCASNYSDTFGVPRVSTGRMQAAHFAQAPLVPRNRRDVDSLAGSMATLVSERTAADYEIEYSDGRAIDMRRSTANTSYWGDITTGSIANDDAAHSEFNDGDAEHDDYEHRDHGDEDDGGNDFHGDEIGEFEEVRSVRIDEEGAAEWIEALSRKQSAGLGSSVNRNANKNGAVVARLDDEKRDGSEARSQKSGSSAAATLNSSPMRRVQTELSIRSSGILSDANSAASSSSKRDGALVSQQANLEASFDPARGTRAKSSNAASASLNKSTARSLFRDSSAVAAQRSEESESLVDIEAAKRVLLAKFNASATPPLPPSAGAASSAERKRSESFINGAGGFVEDGVQHEALQHLPLAKRKEILMKLWRQRSYSIQELAAV